MAVSTNNKFLYVANKAGGSVSVVNPSINKMTKTYPVGERCMVLISPDNDRQLFVASKGKNILSQIDLANDKITTVKLSLAPYHLAYISGLNKLDVSSRKLPKT